MHATWIPSIVLYLYKLHVNGIARYYIIISGEEISIDLNMFSSKPVYCIGTSFVPSGAEVSYPNIIVSIACTKIKWFCPNIA